MVRDVLVEDDGSVSVTIALTVAGCPLRDSFQEQVSRFVGEVPGVTRVRLGFDVMTPEEKTALVTRLRGGNERRPHDLALAGNSRDRRRVREGRCREVDAHREPRVRALVARRAGRRPRRRHLRPLDPAHARRPSEADRGRRDDRAAGSRRPEAHVDRLLPRGERADHVARADAPQGARAVPLGRALG